MLQLTRYVFSVNVFALPESKKKAYRYHIRMVINEGPIWMLAGMSRDLHTSKQSYIQYALDIFRVTPFQVLITLESVFVWSCDATHFCSLAQTSYFVFRSRCKKTKWGICRNVIGLDQVICLSIG